MTTPEYIYQQLRLAGTTKAGACAVLGNVQAESAFRANNLQDVFNSSLGISDDEFVRRVDSGDTSLFMKQNLGFGLAQWTYGTRKEKFLKFMRSKGVSIANEKAQVEFMIKEFKEDFTTMWSMICRSNDLYECTDKLLRIWENPQVKDYTNRRNNAQSWYAKVDSLEKNVTGSSEKSEGGVKASKVETYTQEAINIANDSTHGYSQVDRWGPDYDCSSLVVSVVQNAGIPVRSRGASYTGNMRSAFLSCGFQNVTAQCNLNNGSGMVRGDILLNDAAHAAIFVGNGKVVHARTSEGNEQSGDQSGNEIRVQSYWNYPWNCVLRYSESGTSVSTVQTGVSQSTSTLLKKGSKGAKVKTLQENLIKLGYDVGSWGADGDFGNATYAAVKKFQEDHNLDVDGVVGKQTNEALEKALKGKMDTSKSKEINKGDIVNFIGDKQYVNSRIDKCYSAKPGKAKVTYINRTVGTKHPYHLVKVAGGGSTVYGWVDEADIEVI